MVNYQKDLACNMRSGRLPEMKNREKLAAIEILNLILTERLFLLYWLRGLLSYRWLLRRAQPLTPTPSSTMVLVARLRFKIIVFYINLAIDK